MIKTSILYNELLKNGTDFFAGVPDSLLKSFCAYVTDNAPAEKHIISANEGSATALAAGYHFATGKIPLIYMQNSGEGNMINPLLSLVDPDVYSVPLLILVYTLKNNIPVTAEMKREQAIEKIMLSAPEKAAFVSTTGMASRELYELREKHGMGHEKDFLTVGSMGHASQIALSIALQKPERPVFCIDGDGAAIMQMGGMATVGTRSPKNMVHFVMNNGAHDSVGGQPTVGLEINLPEIAKACRYKRIYSAKTAKELDEVLAKIKNSFDDNTNELTFVEVKVSKGARKDLGRPKSTPQENKKAFMEFLK